MAQIPPIEDTYIDSVIKANQVYDPSLELTQGVKLRELVKLIRDRLEQEIAAAGSPIPAVTEGERVVTQKADGTHTDYTLIDQIISSSALTGADWSTGSAAVSGTAGQFTYDSNYRYDCIATNTWKRSPFIGGNILDEYLANIDDTGGDKTSAELNTAYTGAVVGQKVWGTHNLYIKQTATIWRKISSPIA